jgi:hypothetical protein
MMNSAEWSSDTVALFDSNSRMRRPNRYVDEKKAKNGFYQIEELGLSLSLG